MKISSRKKIHKLTSFRTGLAKGPYGEQYSKLYTISGIVTHPSYQKLRPKPKKYRKKNDQKTLLMHSEHF